MAVRESIDFTSAPNFRFGDREINIAFSATCPKGLVLTPFGNDRNSRLCIGNNNGKKNTEYTHAPLRFQIALETPRVAAVQHEKGCDEWNQKSDEPKGEFSIYPLAFQNE